MDLYGIESKLENVKEKFREGDSNYDWDGCKHCLRIMQRFETDFLNAGNSEGRLLKYYYFVKSMHILGEKCMDKYKNKNDFRDLVSLIRNNEAWSASTKADNKKAVKTFFSWMLEDVLYAEHPKALSWIKVKNKPNKTKEKEHMLKRKEVEKMILNTKNPRYRNFLILLVLSGARLSEILKLKRKFIEFTSYEGRPCIMLSVTGKTGPREIPIYDNYDIIKNLKLQLEDHPSNDPEAYVWYGEEKVERQNIDPKDPEVIISPEYMSRIIKRIADRCGIEKNVHPHLFRHMRATMFMRQGMPINTMNKFFGWSDNGKTALNYSHANTKDVLDKTLDIYEDVADAESRELMKNAVDYGVQKDRNKVLMNFMLKMVKNKPEFSEEFVEFCKEEGVEGMFENN